MAEPINSAAPVPTPVVSAQSLSASITSENVTETGVPNDIVNDVKYPSMPPNW